MHGDSPYLPFAPKTNPRNDNTPVGHECHFEHEGESSWNMDIHAPLLDCVFRGDDSNPVLDYRC